MIDQFLIFDPSGTVHFNHQPGKNYSRVVNSFINDVLINERKMKYVEGSEFLSGSNKESEANAALEAENLAANAADDYISDDNEELDDEDDELDDDEKDFDGDEKSGSKKRSLVRNQDNEDILKYSDSDVTLGSYSFDGYNLKYLIWTDEKSKNRVFFTMLYSSLITVKDPYPFLKNIKILYENTSADLDKFEKFFNLKLSDISTLSESKQPEPAQEVEIRNTNNKDTTTASKGKTSKNNSNKAKKSRKWNTDGTFYEDDGKDESTLDFSSSNTESNSKQTSSNINQLLGDKSTFGTKTTDGFLVNDLSDEMNKIISSSKKKTIEKEKQSSSMTSSAFGFLKKYIGGKKITKEDVTEIKQSMIQHLIKKNVSPNVATSLISEVEKDLIGQTTESFTSIEETAKKSLAKQLKKLLTPDSSIDLLHEIQEKKANSQGPYCISVVGVNGVGKSTNLSKLAFWLLQNDYRVLVAACDTFRSGAVEQLRTHVNNLVQLSPNKKQIELFESGYGGADLVAKIATGAIKYAKENKFDVVLMDTAGRRHNDSHLMAPLASFAKAANPDKIIMVGEALVGTDSVLQAQNFNKAFGANRHLDFFIISKCDTVGDLIGSMVNMVFATGIPILFVGTGQTYTDIRTLSVNWAVEMLMS
ncbi:Signal recognition particle receptor subunit alpha [Pichia kluyveri]|uniref:Signal recognition particle receptor subunit alpha homolog n=1 Tax=Pichia kluyveri TaxID=36015 RepID=A0AAV5R2Q3_PICKL|nr:Signal recognition particle receptor subunit alpha [Pichia kluyveri]